MSEELENQPNSTEQENDNSQSESVSDGNNHLQQKIDELEKERDSWKDKFLRKAAEFENYKKRVENDQISLLNYAAESFIRKILPVVDDFERSLQHINDAQDVENIKKGIELIYSKLIKFLEEHGVTKIEAIGKPFDVHFHEAVMQKEDPNAEPHTVLEELEKGYMLKDKVIRFAKVIVSSDN